MYKTFEGHKNLICDQMFDVPITTVHDKAFDGKFAVRIQINVHGIILVVAIQISYLTCH